MHPAPLVGFSHREPNIPTGPCRTRPKAPEKPAWTAPKSTQTRDLQRPGGSVPSHHAGPERARVQDPHLRLTSRALTRSGSRALSQPLAAEPRQPRLSLRANKLTQRAYPFIDLRSTHFVSAHIFSPRARVHTLKTQAPLTLSGKSHAARAAAIQTSPPLRTQTRPATYRYLAGLHKRTSHTALAPCCSTAVGR